MRSPVDYSWRTDRAGASATAPDLVTVPLPIGTRSGGVRPDVLALPSPTASRTLGLLAAVLTAGMFAGASLHHALPVGRRWLQALAVCESSTFGSTGAADAGGTVNPAFIRCTDPVNSVLAAFEVGGAALALVCCLAVA